MTSTLDPNQFGDTGGPSVPSFGLPKLSLAWDTNTAVAAIVLGALVFLVAIRRGFRPVLVS